MHRSTRAATLAVVCVFTIFLTVLPAAGAVWVSDGPEGGWIASLAISRSNPNELLAATRFGGVFKTTNGGVTWHAANGGIDRPEIAIALTVAIDPINSDIGYVGTGAGVYKTVDAGGTWAESGLSASPQRAVQGLAIDPTSTTTVYAATDHGVFKSTDGGSSWGAASSGLSSPGPLINVVAVAIAPSSSSTVYAGLYGGGVFKSTDGGASWAAANTGLSTDPAFGVFALAIDPSTPTTVYAGTNLGTFKTTDGGSTWVFMNGALPYAYLVAAFAIDPANPAVVYGATTSGGVIKTTDGGSNWTLLSGPQTLQALVMNPSNSSELFVGDIGHGVFKTTDGGTAWSAANGGMVASTASALAVDPAHSGTVFAGTVDGVYKSTDAGATWTVVDAGQFVDALVVHPTASNVLYMANSTGIFKSVDGGASWSQIDTGFLSRALATDPRDPQILFAGGMKTTDGGASWSPANVGLGTGVLRALAVDGSGPAMAASTIIYAGTDDGVFKSTDAGATWTAAGIGDQITAIAVDQSTGTLYVGTWINGIFKSTDRAASWTALNGTLGYGSALAIAPYSHSTVYGAGYSGVLKTIDGGATWASVNGGLEHGIFPFFVEAIAVDSANDTQVYAGSDGGGVFRRLGVCAADTLAACTGEQAAGCRFTFAPSGSAFTDAVTFSPGISNVFGTSLDLSSSVGSMTGNLQLTSFDGSGGAFSTQLSSGPLSFDVTGRLTCPVTGCHSTAPVSITGTVSSISGSALPGNVFYTFDAQVTYTAATSTYSGPCDLNAFVPANTPAGSNIAVSTTTGTPVCGQLTTANIPVDITYPTVISPGSTLVTSSCEPPALANFRSDVKGSMYFFDVTTDAVVTFPVTVCFTYPGSLSFTPAELFNLRLMHFENGQFDDVTTAVDIVAKKICGQVTSLSPFAVAMADPTGAGFVPTDTASRDCSRALTKNALKFAAAVLKCRAKAGAAAFRSHVFDEPACESAAQANYDKKTSGLIGCSPCASNNRTALINRAASVLESANGGLYCAGTVSLMGGGFGFVPPDADASKASSAVAKNLGNLASHRAACGTTAAKALLINASVDRPACDAKAAGKYDQANSHVRMSPACLAANEAPLRQQAETLVDTLTNLAYCAGAVPLPF